MEKLGLEGFKDALYEGYQQSQLEEERNKGEIIALEMMGKHQEAQELRARNASEAVVNVAISLVGEAAVAKVASKGAGRIASVLKRSDGSTGDDVVDIIEDVAESAKKADTIEVKLKPESSGNQPQSIVEKDNDNLPFSGGKPAISDDEYSPSSVSERTIDSRNQYGYQESGDYAGSFKRPEVDDSKLENIVNDVYKGDRHSSYEGTGSTADAARWEYKSEQVLNGSDHLNNKGPQVISRLEKWLKNNPSASVSDRNAAEEMMKDLKHAIKGEKNI